MNTPRSEHMPSPVMRLFGRRTRTLQPITNLQLKPGTSECSQPYLMAERAKAETVTHSGRTSEPPINTNPPVTETLTHSGRISRKPSYLTTNYPEQVSI